MHEAEEKLAALREQYRDGHWPSSLFFIPLLDHSRLPGPFQPLFRSTRCPVRVAADYIPDRLTGYLPGFIIIRYARNNRVFVVPGNGLIIFFNVSEYAARIVQA